MLQGRPKLTADTLTAYERLKNWTRARFGLAHDDVVFVAEVSCGLPGCPLIETVVAFWSAPETRHQFIVFKPLLKVVEGDLPPAWMRPELVAGEEDISCC
jgi:nitrate reductase delta subunit